MISRHMCISIRSMLNWTRAETKKNLRNISKDDGSKFTFNEFRNYLMDELSKGHEVLPMGECDNFDFIKGCQGHDLLISENSYKLETAK